MDPPLIPIKPLHKTLPLANFKGLWSWSPVPLWIRAWYSCGQLFGEYKMLWICLLHIKTGKYTGFSSKIKHLKPVPGIWITKEKFCKQKTVSSSVIHFIMSFFCVFSLYAFTKSFSHVELAPYHKYEGMQSENDQVYSILRRNKKLFIEDFGINLK